MSSNVIAIDGPAGSGKSTVAPLVAQKLGLEHLDTGLMYRAVAWACIYAGTDLADATAVAELAQGLQMRIGLTDVEIDGRVLSAELRTAEVSKVVSVVAANEGVRVSLVDEQRQWVVDHNGGVLDGRDIGTAVFPDAKLKIFLVADIAERAKRRAADCEDSVEEIAADIERRDKADSTRQSMPLVQAQDAHLLDTTKLTVDQVVAKICELWNAS